MLVAPHDGVGLAFVLVLGAVHHIVGVGGTVGAVLVVAPDQLGVAVFVGGLGEVQAVAVHHHIPQDEHAVAGLVRGVELVTVGLQVSQQLADDLRVVAAVHIQHVFQRGSGHPHGQVLLALFLFQVGDVLVLGAVVGKGTKVGVVGVLGQQEVGQLVALCVFRPESVGLAVIIGQGAAGDDELLTGVVRVPYNGGSFHMGVILDKNLGVGAVDVDAAVVIIALYKDGAVIHSQGAKHAQIDAGIRIVQVHGQNAALVHQNIVVGIISKKVIVIVRTIGHVVDAAIRDMQLGSLAVAELDGHIPRGGIDRAVARNEYIPVAGNDAVVRLQVELAAIFDDQAAVFTRILTVNGIFTIVLVGVQFCRDIGSGMIKRDGRIAVVAGLNAEALALNGNVRILEGDVTGGFQLGAILSRTAAFVADAGIAVGDVEGAVLGSQAGAGTLMAVNAGLGVLDVQLALGLDDDVVPAGNANTAVLVRFTVFPYMRTVDGQGRTTVQREITVLGDATAALGGAGNMGVLDGDVRAIRDGDAGILLVRAACDHHTGGGVLDGQAAAGGLFGGVGSLFLVALDGQVGVLFGAREVGSHFAAHADAFHVDVAIRELLAFFGGTVDGCGAVDDVVALEGQVNVRTLPHVQTGAVLLVGLVDGGIFQGQVHLGVLIFVGAVQILADVDAVAAGGQGGILDGQVNVCALADGHGGLAGLAGVGVHAVDHDIHVAAFGAIILFGLFDVLLHGDGVLSGGILVTLDDDLAVVLFVLVDVGAVLLFVLALIAERAAVGVLINGDVAFGQIIAHGRSAGADGAHGNGGGQRDSNDLFLFTQSHE